MTIRFSRAAPLALACLLASWPAASEAAPAEKAPGPFIQCDGRTGHVGAGESFLRLLLVSATAGLSETAMADDDDSKRAKGIAGVAACDAALSSEKDRYRRVQLGLAKALHYGEDQRWAEAARTAHETPALIVGGDWALDRSAATAAANIKAWALIQQGKLAEAEEVQAAAVLRAGADALALQRIPPYLRLTQTMSDTKRRALWHMLKFAPQHSSTVINSFADAHAYDDARVAVATFDAVQRAMFTRPPSKADTASLDAGYAAMAGKAAEAAQSLAAARTEFAKERAEGSARAGLIASVEEQIAFAEAALAYAEGRQADARKLISQRTLWGNIAPGMVADLLTRLKAGAPDDGGVDPAKLWDESVAGRVAALKEDRVRKKQWRTLVELMVDDHYRPLARQAMTGSAAKPKWLLKQDKEDPLKFDVISVDGRFYGVAVNEPLMLHAALIAKARGKQGFVLLPARKELGTIGMKAVNPGDDGIRGESIISAAPLVDALAPHINPPTPAGAARDR